MQILILDMVCFLFLWEVLVKDKEKAKKKYRNVLIDNATIDDILLLHIKGEQNQ